MAKDFYVPLLDQELEFQEFADFQCSFREEAIVERSDEDTSRRRGEKKERGRERELGLLEEKYLKRSRPSQRKTMSPFSSFYLFSSLHFCFFEKRSERKKKESPPTLSLAQLGLIFPKTVRLSIAFINSLMVLSYYKTKIPKK